MRDGPDGLKISRQASTGVFADCTRSEFDRRIAGLRDGMRRHGVDGLLVTQDTNVRYVAGFHEVGWIVPAYFYAVLVPAREDLPMAIFCPEGDQIQTQASWIETVVRWDFPIGFYTGRVGNSLADAIVAWVDHLGLARGRIATELGAHFRVGLSVDCLDRIRSGLPAVSWQDCGEVLWPVRSIKSPEEIRRLREAARISGLGVAAGFEAIRPGVSEREVAGVMAARMHALGGGEIRFLSLYAGPDRALWADSIPRRDMTIQPGSLVQFDGGCTYEGYFCDFKRMACLGEPTPDELLWFEVARASEQAAIDAIGPGVPCGEVYEASQEVIRAAGHGAFVDWCQGLGWSGIGHGLGLDIHELPGLSLGSEVLLQPGMVLAIEPFFYEAGRFPLWEIREKFGLEDVVLVTEEGSEVLTPDTLIDRSIWVA